jgi:hypothetical protein
MLFRHAAPHPYDCGLNNHISILFKATSTMQIPIDQN